MHDVFLSFTRTGHPDLAHEIRQRLTMAGISVFLDEDLPHGESIGAEIAEALNASKIMLVVYSASYNQRWACQWELIHARFAGAAEGSPGRRILIVNPEPGDEHITQVETADSKFLRPDELHLLVGRVRRKLAQVGGPMGSVRRLAPPRWLPPAIPGAFGFTGRFTDLWAVHNSLSAADMPLTQPAATAPLVVVTGMPGIGKTSLVRAYAWLFGDGYPGGVFYINTRDSGDTGKAREQFVGQVRQIARYLHIATAAGNEDVIGLVGDLLTARRLPSLWIIDDLPAKTGGADLGQFVIPAPTVRTVFTAPSCGGGATEVRLGGLEPADGLEVLRSGRALGPADLDAARSIVRRLGGHPLALTVAAAYLRECAGLVSLADYDRCLAEDGPDPDIVAAIGRSMGTLTSADRIAITLAGLLGPDPVPPRLISGVLGAVDPRAGPATRVAAGTFARLSHGGFAVVGPSGCQIHPLVVQAAARLGAPSVPPGTVAAAAARELAGLLSASPGDYVLAGHARVLVDGGEVPDVGAAWDLGRLVAGHSERAGDLAQAAARRYHLAETAPDSAADQVAAALACVANGEFGRGIERGRRALSLGLTAEQETQARWALAAGLDGLGRFPQADDLWAWLAAGRDPGPARRAAFGVAKARAMLARGQLARARPILESVLTESCGAEEDQLNAARIEMARLMLWTSREQEGRRLAESVVRYYRKLDVPTHALCMEAGQLWAQATVHLGLFELRPDTSRWAEAEVLLGQLAADYARSAGPHSIHGLAALVQQGLMSVYLGKPAECREILRLAEPELRTRLGDRHPLLLHARYALGLAHFQLREYGPASQVLGAVWQAQREVIGPCHPDTLHSQLQYGVALKLADRRQSARSAQLIRDVCSSVARTMGRRNDLYGQAFVASLLLPATPAAAVQFFQNLDQILARWRKR